MTLDNIQVGCIVFINPEELRLNGVQCPIIGVHPFACIGISPSGGDWVALSSKPTMGWRDRMPIPQSQLRGSKRWTTTPCFLYDPSYRWTIPGWLIQEAALRSNWRHEVLNFIAPDGIEQILRWVAPMAG